MIIRVSEIPDEGIRIDGPEAFTRPFADSTWSLDAVELTLEKDADAVFVRGTLEARVPLVCGRCLEPFDLRVSSDVDTRFLPAPEGRAEERELASDDLDSDVYAHDQLDLGALVETETTLALPMKPLCRDNCRGLCPVCGGNRNATDCACETPAPDLRWAALKDWAGRSK